MNTFPEAAWSRYQKRPVIVEAFRHQGEPFVIKTLEGDMTVETGAWVVRGVKGEYYPVRDDIFRETYISRESNMVKELVRTSAMDELKAMSVECNRIRHPFQNIYPMWRGKPLSHTLNEIIAALELP